MKPEIAIAAALALAAGVGVAAYATFHQGPAAGESGSQNEIAALRTQVEELRAELSSVQTRLHAAQTATAAPVDAPIRSVAQATSSAPSTAGAVAAVNVSTQDRDTIFALIKEERDLREKERQEKQREQLRDGLDRRVKQSAERVGIDANTSQTIARLYLDNLSREEDIRRAYPVQDWNDPNSEKRRLELDAARKSLEATVAGLIPSDKLEAWNREARGLNRMGDMAAMIDQPADAFRGFGGMFGGPGGGPGGGGPMGGGQRGAGGNGGGGRGNRGGGNNAGAAAPSAPKAPGQQE